MRLQDLRKMTRLEQVLLLLQDKAMKVIDDMEELASDLSEIDGGDTCPHDDKRTTDGEFIVLHRYLKGTEKKIAEVRLLADKMAMAWCNINQFENKLLGSNPGANQKEKGVENVCSHQIWQAPSSARRDGASCKIGWMQER